MGSRKYSRFIKPYGKYEGPRPATVQHFVGFDDLDWLNFEIIVDCLYESEFLVFEYYDRVRLVAPFALGVSRYGNGLLRAFQIDGLSRKGPGFGWRVFQVRNMSMVEGYGEYFFIEDFDFDDYFPWIYAVYLEVQDRGK